MAKLTMLRGLPASGKSTYAREQVDKTGNSARINRDDLRAMMFNSKWSGPREKFVVKAEELLARLAIECGMNPIIDDTNMPLGNRALWSATAAELGAKFEVVEMQTSIQQCIRRDAVREVTGGFVGGGVIENLALTGGLIDFPDKFIVCDVDGTLADLTNRLHHIQKEPKDYEMFFEMMVDDEPIWPVINWVTSLAENYMIVLVSGRPAYCWERTMAWMDKYGVPASHLFMRRSGDHRPDTMIKNGILSKLPKERILFAIDDRPCVVEQVWRANGVKVIPVGTWRGAF